MIFFGLNGFSSKSERNDKGKSIIDLPSSFTVIDLETTGLDPSWDSIIEFGAVRVKNNVVTDEFSSLVNPGFEIDDFITELTGITNEMLSSAPTIEHTLPDFLSFIGNDIVVGHNVNFDINFIYDKCKKHLKRPFSNDFIDTMRLSRRLYPTENHHRLSDLVQRFGIGTGVDHRALSDVSNTLKCYLHMKQSVIDLGIPIASIAPKKVVHSAKDIHSQNTCFDESSSVYGKQFVFTGALEKMTRTQAMQMVVDLGGMCGDGVSMKTNFLVLGCNDYCTTIKDGKSSKQKKAEQLKLSGNDIEIISENVFYDMIE